MLSNLLSSRLLTAAVLGLTVSVAGCSRQSDDSAQPAAIEAAAALDRSHHGSEMPDLSFRDAAGQQMRLNDFKGKPLLINLWATWCAPCKAEMPALERLAAAQQGSLKVLTVAQDSRQLEKVAAFFTAGKFARIEPWLDPEMALSGHFQVATLPTSIYYDASGREVWRYSGPREWEDAETAALLAEAR